LTVKVAKSAGFCFGVENAVSIALSNAGKNAHILGDLIHNEEVIKKLKEKGLNIVRDLAKIPDYATVIIRSHGVGEEIIDTLKKRRCKIINATCPYVEKIHKLVNDHYKKGYKIVIIGNPGHPEVEGINGWCGNSAEIIESIQDIDRLKEDKYCVVVQTTFDFTTFREIAETLKNRFKIVAIYETICYTTKVRQEEAYKLAKECDVMLVIGSLKSANTKKLYDICASVRERTYLISNVSELSSVKFINNDIVGITAGASTPKELMMEVINRMNQQDEMVMTTDTVMPETAAMATDTVIEKAAEEPAALTQQDKKDPDSIKTMADVMKKTKFGGVREGKKVKGKIIKTADEGLYVNIGLGKDGFIDKDEVSADGYNISDYKIDDEIEAIVISAASKEYINLSKKKADILRQEEEETERILKGSEFTLSCNEVVKGGLVGRMGSYTIFVPASEIRLGYVIDLEQYKGKPLRLRAIPEKEKGDEEGKKRRRNNKRIVASQRVILAEEKEARENHFWSQMIPGNIVEGKVKRYAPFGVFVSVMGFDCLVHISDVSWVKVDDPATVLKINETYEFEILKADRDKGRVSLSYKSLQKTPYEIAAEKYPVGSVVNGVVDRLATFGAFIKIEEGVDGLVHVSQISHDWIKDASQALKVGQEVTAKVIKFEDNKITLSIKELLPEPGQEVGAEAEEETDIKKRSKKSKDDKKAQSDAEFKEWVEQEDAVTIGDLFADLKDIVPEEEK
jgi:(E)-4-hydroxy-3-methyl-but-2-enyl pyrophosphate reductase